MNILVQKSVCVVMAVALLSLVAFSFGNPARAQSTPAQLAQIQTLLGMIEQLQAQLAKIQGGSSSGGHCVELSRSLFLGSSDSDSSGQVSKLQRFLTDTGHYTYGGITGYYGPATERAVQAWQASKGLVSSGSPEATGYGMVGPSTRSAMARGCTAGTSGVSPVAPNLNLATVELSVEGSEDAVTAEIYDRLSFNYTVDGDANDCEVSGSYRNGTLTVKKSNANFRITDVSGSGAFYVSYVYPYDILEEVTVSCEDDATGDSITSSVDVEFLDTGLADYEIELDGETVESGADVTKAEALSRCKKEANEEANNGLRLECSWDGREFEDLYVNTGKA